VEQYVCFSIRLHGVVVNGSCGEFYLPIPVAHQPNLVVGRLIVEVSESYIDTHTAGRTEFYFTLREYRQDY
jgi:hypothetical protein